MSPVAEALARFRLPSTLLFSCTSAAFLNTSCTHQKHSTNVKSPLNLCARLLPQQARHYPRWRCQQDCMQLAPHLAACQATRHGASYMQSNSQVRHYLTEVLLTRQDV